MKRALVTYVAMGLVATPLGYVTGPDPGHGLRSLAHPRVVPIVLLWPLWAWLPITDALGITANVPYAERT